MKFSSAKLCGNNCQERRRDSQRINELGEVPQTGTWHQWTSEEKKCDDIVERQDKINDKKRQRNQEENGRGSTGNQLVPAFSGAVASSAILL